MAIFRFSLGVCGMAVVLACSSSAGQVDKPEAVPPRLAAGVQSGPAIIDPVAPARDSVGPSPMRFEWTAVAGADHYEIELTTDIDLVVFEHNDVRETTLAMPKDFTLMAGTYFWRVGAYRDRRLVGDSGRAAFVVKD